MLSRVCICSTADAVFQGRFCTRASLNCHIIFWLAPTMQNHIHSAGR